jgi:putative transcription factor
MQCEMCGKSVESYFRVKTEGTILNVCGKCRGFGELIQAVTPAPEKKIEKIAKPKPAEPEIIEDLVEGYAEKIKNKRERLGLKQEELAQKINEKESIIHKIESGHFTPPIELAKKLERFLGIKIIEEVEDAKVNIAQKVSGEGFSLGDFIKVKK